VDIHKELQSSTEYPKTEFRIQTEIECVSTKSSKYVPNFQVCHLKIIESMDFCMDFSYVFINTFLSELNDSEGKMLNGNSRI